MDNKQHPKYIGARIKAARQAAGYKSAQIFCKKHRIPYQTHSQHIRGIRKPTDTYLKQYSHWLHVNEHWLKTGEGNSFTENRHTNQIKENLAILETNVAQTTINKGLLTEILIQLQSLKTTPEILATAASEIYTDITSSESNTGLQFKMVTPMATTYRRFLKK